MRFSLCFLTSWNSASIIVQQLVTQLVCKVYYTRNQLPFYFRWTKRILKYCILPLYYFYYCSLLQILLLQCGFCYLDGDKTEYTYFDKFFNLFFDLLPKIGYQAEQSKCEWFIAMHNKPFQIWWQESVFLVEESNPTIDLYDHLQNYNFFYLSIIQFICHHF